METLKEIFVFASPEIQELLADNQTDLVELLKREGITVSSGFAHDPTDRADVGSKDPTGIILASASLIVSLTPLLSKIIAALSHKSVEVHEMVLVPVEDSQGNVVRDHSDQPILYWVRRTRIVESIEKTQEAYSISLKSPLGFEITYSSSPKIVADSDASAQHGSNKPEQRG